MDIYEKYLTSEELEKVKKLPPLSDEAEHVIDLMAELLADDFYSRQEAVNE